MTIITEDLSENQSSPWNYQYIKNFSKRMLKTHLFIGNFHEKRFVEPLAAYRDVVRIDPDEDKFIENLLIVKRKVTELRSSSIPWIGITEPDTIGAPVGYNLWVELPVEIFGSYWFKVRTVDFLQDEICLKLDVVRPLKRELTLEESGIRSEEFDLTATMNDISNKIKVTFRNFCRDYVTYQNTKETLVFMFLLFSTIVVGGLKVVKYLMEYLVTFMRELSGLIIALTPIITTFLNIIKTISLSIVEMIFGLWSDKGKNQAPQYNAYFNVDPRMMKFPNSAESFSQYPTRMALPNHTSRPAIHPFN